MIMIMIMIVIIIILIITTVITTIIIIIIIIIIIMRKKMNVSSQFCLRTLVKHYGMLLVAGNMAMCKKIIMN